MDGRPTWTDCDEAGDYVVPNLSSPRDLVFRPDNMDETVPHTCSRKYMNTCNIQSLIFYQNVTPNLHLASYLWSSVLLQNLKTS